MNPAALVVVPGGAILFFSERNDAIMLTKRLAACAALVTPGGVVCDVGTDHAYLPAELLRRGQCTRAVATDIHAGPLEAAKRTLTEAGVLEQAELFLCDGLAQVQPEGITDVVIAGMGGELILRIISEAPWLCAMDKHLVLQPMTTAMQLREGLAALGFTIDREEAVVDSDKIYSVMSVYYTDQKRDNLKLIDLYMGQIKPGSPFSARYAKSVRHNIENKIKGMRHGGADSSALEILLQMLLDLYGEEENA